MAKNKKDSGKAQNKQERKSEGQKGCLGKIHDYMQTTEFQIIILIMSLIWLFLIIFFIIKIRRMTNEYEQTQLDERPFEFINFTIVTFGSILQRRDYKDDIAIKFMDRIMRISGNATFRETVTNVTGYSDIIPKLFTAIEKRSKTCLSSETVKVVDHLINTTSTLIDVADGKFQYCSPAAITKALSSCPGERSVFDASMNLMRSFLRSTPFCGTSIVKELSNYALEKGVGEENDEIINLLVNITLDNSQSNDSVCSFLNEYSVKEHLFTSETKNIICSAYQKLKCENAQDLYDFCNDIDENNQEL